MRWRGFTAELVTAFTELGVELVILLGALLADSPHTRPLQVTAATSGAELAAQLHVEPVDYKGPTGIVGVLQQACATAGMPSVSLWAAVPHYVAQPPSPKATLALLRSVEDILDISLPLADLPAEARAWERGVDELAEQDSDVAEYVRSLEEAKDATDLPEASGDAIAREFERYLRRRGDRGEHGGRWDEALRIAGAPRGGALDRRPGHGRPVGTAGAGAPCARAAARSGGWCASTSAAVSQPLSSAARSPCVSSSRSAGQRAIAVDGQPLAAPLPQHGAQLVLLAEADPVVAAVEVTARRRAADGRSCGRRCSPPRRTPPSAAAGHRCCGPARPGRRGRRRRSTAGTCRGRTGRPGTRSAAPRPSPPLARRRRRPARARPACRPGKSHSGRSPATGL